MTGPGGASEALERDVLDRRVARWRSYMLRRRSLTGADVDELEDHLRARARTLAEAGLTTEEAFLVAVKRLGSVDALTREYAREHSHRLWKQLVLAPSREQDGIRSARSEVVVALALAIGAALALKAPTVLGVAWDEANAPFFVRNMSFFVLPFLFAYFWWKRQLERSAWVWACLVFGLAAGAANLYPFGPDSQTQVLTALHLPIALWLGIGIAYVGGRWSQRALLMDFVRFSGELFIYFVLIALGGGVLTGFTMLTFNAIGVSLETFAQEWILPCGAVGAVVVASWLVEAKQSVVENMAPVLTRLFTPLFTVALLGFLVTMAWTGSSMDVGREMLIGFDLLLAIVLGLVLYAISARDPQEPPGLFDFLNLVLIAAALLVDLMALAAIMARITEFGFSANKVAALGENLVLLANLSWTACLYFRFLRRSIPFGQIERWQVAYLPVYSIWAAVVVVGFPALFGFS